LRFGTTAAKYLHLLKLLTGVDISTLEVKRSGKEGKTTKSNSLSADAPTKTASFRLSTGMMKKRGRVELLVHNISVKGARLWTSIDHNISKTKNY
jgi:hypothetical protein